MFEKKDVTQVKKDIEACVGQKIMLKSNLGRNKIVEKEAKLLNTYPNLFIVQFQENERKATYSYTDVLIKSVEISVSDGKSDYHNLFYNDNTNVF